jgi:DNA-binding transcriptional regulator LsrR (DeoR family)
MSINFYLVEFHMKRAQTEESTIDMIAAAYLAAEGRRQQEIAYILGITPVAVSRHLAKARKKYLRYQVNFLHHEVPVGLMDKVRQRVSRQALEDQLNHLADRHGQDRKLSLRVFPCGPCEDDRERMQKLASAAAPLIRTLLLRSRSCGLTWGGMLKRCVTGLRNLSYPPPWTKETIQFIPLSGEPLGRERASFSSSSLARDLGIIVNGDQYDAPSLAMVPAFIPDGFQKYEKDGVWKLIELVKSYHEIFGPHRNGSAGAPAAKRAAPLAMGLDMILTSVGSHDRPLGFGRGVLFDKMSVSYEELKSLIVAEIGGVCIARQNLSPQRLEQFDTVQKSWTGLSLEHLEACARRGTDLLKGPPGVVVVSGGTKRAAGVCELIKRGLVNHLIVDEILAAELEAVSRPKRQG